MQRPGNAEPSFTLGLEEEYLLVDLATRDLVADPPPELLQRCIADTDGRVSPEFLRSQLEVKTSVCGSVAAMRRELGSLRRKVCEISANYGIAPVAVSTHPFARAPHRPPHTDHERYADIAREVQGGARRMLICGMHVHVGLEDDELRIDVMNQLSYFVPHLLALYLAPAPVAPACRILEYSRQRTRTRPPARSGASWPDKAHPLFKTTWSALGSMRLGLPSLPRSPSSVSAI